MKQQMRLSKHLEEASKWNIRCLWREKKKKVFFAFPKNVTVIAKRVTELVHQDTTILTGLITAVLDEDDRFKWICLNICIKQIRIWANCLLFGTLFETAVEKHSKHDSSVGPYAEQTAIQSGLHFTANDVFIDIYLCSSIRDCILNCY